MVSGLPQQRGGTGRESFAAWWCSRQHKAVGSGGSLAVPWVEEGCQWLCRQKELGTSARLSWHGHLQVPPDPKEGLCEGSRRQGLS